jgi:hypothetical protein
MKSSISVTCLAIDTQHQQVAGRRVHRETGIGVEDREIMGHVPHKGLGLPLGHVRAGRADDGLHRRVERGPRRRQRHLPLNLVRVQAVRQIQVDVDRVQRRKSAS